MGLVQPLLMRRPGCGVRGLEWLLTGLSDSGDGFPRSRERRGCWDEGELWDIGVFRFRVKVRHFVSVVLLEWLDYWRRLMSG